MIKLIDILKESISGGTVYTYRSQKSLPDIKANGIKMGNNKSNSQFFELPDYGYSYYTSTSKDSNWVDYNPFGDENTPYTVRVSIDLNKIKNDKNYNFKELDIPNHPEYQEVRIYSNTKNRIPPEYISSIDILRRKSGDTEGTAISIIKYETIKLMLEIIMDEPEEIDEQLGAKGTNNLSIPFKLAFNTLLYKKLLNKI
jgi:hypothetical protein